MSEQIKLPELPSDADKQISIRVDGERKMLEDANFGTVSVSDSIHEHKNGKQRFAVFGVFARELHDTLISRELGEWQAIKPALLNGQAFCSQPDEGQSRVLHWRCSSKKPDQWELVWAVTGWLWTKELGQTPEQVENTIVNEIIGGTRYDR